MLRALNCLDYLAFCLAPRGHRDLQQFERRGEVVLMNDGPQVLDDLVQVELKILEELLKGVGDDDEGSVSGTSRPSGSVFKHSGDATSPLCGEIQVED